jgi:hypothetical protein
MIRRLSALLLLVAAMAASPLNASSASEDRFIYVDRMPATRGELMRSVSGEDGEGGLRLQQDLYAEDYEHAVIETYVLKAACGEEREPKTFIHAIKYPPKNPSTFAVATLHDIYKDVYVLDGSGKIRLYEDVQGQQMLTLTERFKPACLPT